MTQLRVTKLHPRFKVCILSYLRVLFQSSYPLLIFWFTNHKKIKGTECIHVTSQFSFFSILFHSIDYTAIYVLQLFIITRVIYIQLP